MARGKVSIKTSSVENLKRRKNVKGSKLESKKEHELFALSENSNLTFETDGEENQERLLDLMYMHQVYHKLIQTQQYALRGSKITCQYGTKPALLDMQTDYGVLMGDQPVMTCADCRQSNIHNFGSCMCPESLYMGRVDMTAAFHPNGEPAVRAPGNKYPHICVPLVDVKTGWKQENGEVWIENSGIAMQALMQNGILVCQYGGVISIRQVYEYYGNNFQFTYTHEKYVVWGTAINIRSTPMVSEDNIINGYRANPKDRINVKVYSNGYISGLHREYSAKDDLWWVEIELESGETAWIAEKYILPDKPIVTTFPKKINAVIKRENGDIENSEYEPTIKWGQAGRGRYNELELITKKRYNVAIGSKIINPKYPDTGKILDTDFDAFSKEFEVLLKNKKTGKERILPCNIYDIKAHTYNKYPDGHKFNMGVEVTIYEGGLGSTEKKLENGLMQTGIRYPRIRLDDDVPEDEWAEYTLGGNIIEFCSKDTGDLDCSEYELISVTVNLLEEE